MTRDTLTLCLAGDAMTGRGIDQIQQHPGDPTLHEQLVRDARDYVRLAEAVHGPVPAPVAPAYIWGEALAEIERHAPDLRLVNLETAVTTADAPWPGKGVHYRMHPANVGCLTAARIDCCALANNHVLDFEVRGLRDTLHALDAAGIRHAGAGLDLEAAAAPALLEVHGASPCRVALLACTDNQPDFAATGQHPGTHYLEVSLEADTLARVADAIGRARAAGADWVVFSNHWGANFVERPAPDFREFARHVIELGADVVYGHSAHICQGIEIHRGKPILYDTGDFIDDYAVDPVLRNDRSCLFKLMFDQGRLQRIELVPVTLDIARVALAHGADFEAIAVRMERLCGELGTALQHHAGRLVYEAQP